MGGMARRPAAPCLGARVGRSTVNEMIGPALVLIAFAWIPTLLITT